jgi:iron complex outermembrane receptor protein
LCITRRVSLFCAVLGALCASALPAQSNPPPATSVASMPLAQALEVFARQTGLQLVYVSEAVQGAVSKGAPAGLTARETLNRLLEGTGVTFEFLNERTVRIFPIHSTALPTKPAPGGNSSANRPSGARLNARADNDHDDAHSYATDEERGDKAMTVRNILARIAGLFAVCSAALHSAGACAQETAETQAQAGPQMLEEVIVTARKRTESLQNVPVAVAPVSKLQLQNNDATDLVKLAELAPQVLIGQTATGTGALISIRGISSAATDSGLDQSVSVDIDGIQLSRGRIISSAIYDMQQVEVMEGPQALFFGKNSPAGVIALHTADPSDKAEAYLKAGYEFEADESSVEGALSGPITPGFKARFAFRYSYMEGWMKDIATLMPDPCSAKNYPVCAFTYPGAYEPGAGVQASSPKGHDIAGRLTLLWTPWQDFDAKFKLNWDEQTGNGQNANSETFCTGGHTQATELGFFPLPATNCIKNRENFMQSPSPTFTANIPYGNNGVPYSLSRILLTSLTLSKTFDDITLTSTTGFYNQTLSDSGVSDHAWAQIYNAEHEHYQLVTQELRANTSFSFPVNFTGGVYYEHFDRKFFNAPILYPSLTGFNPAGNNFLNSEEKSDSTGDTFSVFGQARWNIIPKVELAVGARYSHDVKDTNIVNLANNPLSCAVLKICLYPQGQVFYNHYNDDNVSPEATLSWHPNPDQTLYVAYKVGYKAGGLSDSSLLLANASPGRWRFGHETAKGEEVGYKADLLDRRLRVDVTAYTYEYDGLQVASVDNSTATPIFVIKNAASARTQGGEASSEWLATDALTFRGNVGYNHARYRQFPGAQCYAQQTAAQGCIGGVQNLAGQSLLRAPDVTFDLGGDYRALFAHGWTADMSVDGYYTSHYETAGDENPGGVQPSFWRLNAAVHLTPPNQHFEFSVIGRDLTNSYYLLASNGAAGGSPWELAGYFNRPREVLIQAEYRY